jgi:hypothetical protein
MQGNHDGGDAFEWRIRKGDHYMTHRYLKLALAAAILFAPTSYALADDRAPTDEERAQIEQVLRGEGFTRWDDIELDDGVWEVDDAVGSDGREYDLKLNQQFQITERKAN